MTRINVVPVECLSNKHLLAEYKEITRPFNKVKKHLEAGRKPSNLRIPAQYCLGTGHETFFFDKLEWLVKRYEDLYNELCTRKFKMDFDKFHEIHGEFICTFYTTAWWGDYTPTPKDMYLNMARLVKRSNMSNVLDELAS